MTTDNIAQSIQNILDQANPAQLADALRKLKLGSALGLVKVTVTGLTASAAIDITTAAVYAAATINVGAINVDRTTLPPIGSVRSLRCTASGTANSVGSYGITDAGGTAVSPTAGANLGIAKLSDDGTTLTFPSTITAFVLEYYPAPAADVTDDFLS